MIRPLLVSLILLIQMPGKPKNQAAIKIISATERQWAAGASPGRTGITYKIKLRIETEAKVDFQNLWIGEQHVPFTIAYFTPVAPAKLNKGDSLLLVYNHIDNEAPDSVAKRLPMKYEGAALIEYSYKKQAQYVVVKSFVNLNAFKGE
jgi:hypothetical protein